MPRIQVCAYQGCGVLTMGAFCLEHEPGSRSPGGPREIRVTRGSDPTQRGTRTFALLKKSS